jgi:hypothetical protein
MIPEDMRIEYRDKEGNNITLQQWNGLFEDREYSKIIQEVVGEYFVSTVWLGVENFNKNFFETIVFKGKEIMYMERYEHIYQALQGHEEIKKEIENGTFKEPSLEI